jgi:hypothetical protein
MEGKRIQFGQTQGWLIFALGLFLIAAQTVLSFHIFPGSVEGATSPDGSAAVQNTNHSMFFIPGILGIITIGVACYFLLQDRFKTSNPNPPAKTKSGFPM